MMQTLNVFSHYSKSKIEIIRQTGLAYPWLLALIPALIVMLVYLPSLWFDFVWDDALFLYDHPLYRDPDRWAEALQQPFVLSPNYFRPLALTTFLIELRLWQGWPLPFHLTNVLLHALNTILVVILAQCIWPGARTRPGLSLAAGLLYGLHPALVESVAFISSRFDLLLTTALLLALLADVNLRHHSVARPLVVGLAFFVAALSKEMAVAFALVLPVWHIALMKINPKKPKLETEKGKMHRFNLAWAELSRHRYVYLAVFLAGLGYLFLRYLLLGYLYLPKVGNPTHVGSSVQHLLLVARSLAEYALLTIWPFATLRLLHTEPLPIQLDDIAALLALLVMLALVAGMGWLGRGQSGRSWLIVAWAIALIPVLNILPLILGGGAFVAERFLTFPLVFVALAILPFGHFSLPGVMQTGLVLWLIAAMITVQLTLSHWQNELTLWSWTAERAPNSALPYINLANVYNRLGLPEQALDKAERALQRDSAESNAWNHKGLALFRLERYKDAEIAFARAGQLEPTDPLYWNNLAAALREQDRFQEAEQLLLNRVLPIAPDLAVGHLNIGTLYLRIDRLDLAVYHLQEAERLLPFDQANEARALLNQTKDPARWLRLGDLLLAQRDSQRALAAFEQAVKLGASTVDGAIGRSAALMELGRWQEAETTVQAALDIAPEDARLYNNLGVIARERGDLDRAYYFFSRAIELAPGWELPRQNLAALDEI